MRDEKREQYILRKTLKDVERIHSLVHPNEGSDLLNARRVRENAVRVTILQMALSIEAVLDDMFKRSFLGYRPRIRERNERKERKPRDKRFKDLEELLRGGRLGFETKLRLASIMGLTTKIQSNRLDKLRILRNKCAHSWVLDTIHKRGRKQRQTRRLLEFEGRNLFDLKVLENFMQIYRSIFWELVMKVVYAK